MKVFVLNLERAVQRRAFMQAQLDRLGLDYEFIRGSDYREMSEDDFRQLCSARAIAVDSYLRGVFAASLSHLEICKAIVEQGHSHALVLEDDVILPTNIAETLEDVAQTQKSDSIVLLRYYCHRNEPLLLSRSERVPTGKDGEFVAPVDIDSVASAAAYVITGNVARRMLDNLYPVDHVPDNWGPFYRKGIFSSLYCRHPQVVRDAPFLPLVEYPATQTFWAKLKSIVRRAGIINRLASSLRREVGPPSHCLSFTDAPPFWDRRFEGTDA